MSKIFIGDNKWFDDSGLQHAKNGYKNSIDWSNSIGCTVEFQYRNYHGSYTINDRFPHPKFKGKYLYTIYFNNDKEKLYEVDTATLKEVCFGKILDIFQYDIGDIINGNLLILERGRKPFFKNEKIYKYYVYKCLIDGYIGECPEIQMNETKECPVCSFRTVMIGVNDIATLKPEIVRLLKNKEDAYKYTAHTNKKLDFCCDICGAPFSASPSQFPTYLPCGCYSSNSYPNRFICELFNQLNIDYISELRRCHFSWCQNYRYDLYFEIDNKKYIVEMDGYHHKDSKQMMIDKEKDKIAFENDVEVIRIDCDYITEKKRFSYIQRNVVNSKLSDILNLKNVDWNEINTKILTTNITKDVWALRNTGYSYKQISNILNVSLTKISRLVTLGYNLNELKTYSENKGNSYSKVMVVLNLETMETKYYIGVNDFYDNSLEYIGKRITNKYFNKHQKDGHLILNGYDISKITYADYIRKLQKKKNGIF